MTNPSGQNVKALFFDVGGTIFDWKNTAIAAVNDLSKQHDIPIDATAFANDWRVEMFKVQKEVRYGNLPWMNADGMHFGGLDALRSSYPLIAKLDDEALMDLVKATWHNLNAFAGAAEAITRLRSKYTVVVLTILSWESIVASSKKAGVQWDGILSCEFLGHYKPSIQAYADGMDLLGLEPDESMMVAAHKGDLAAAQDAGMHTTFVTVPEDDIVTGGFGAADDRSFSYEAEGFEDLCNKLGV